MWGRALEHRSQKIGMLIQALPLTFCMIWSKSHNLSVLESFSVIGKKKTKHRLDFSFQTSNPNMQVKQDFKLIPDFCFALPPPALWTKNFNTLLAHRTILSWKTLRSLPALKFRDFFCGSVNVGFEYVNLIL